MKKIMLIYPPGSKFQRGEERCQANVSASTSTSMRACNDLGYVSAELKKSGHDVFLKDYQGENSKREELEEDFESFKPDVLFISTTNGTIFDDIEVINILKNKKQDTLCILKGALFFDIKKDALKRSDLKNVEIVIGGEAEFIMPKLIEAYYYKNSLDNISGIYYKNKKWIKTDFTYFEKDLDKLSFPDRHAMNNKLYVRPDTNEPMATISTARGCPASCIYCLSPIISGRELRKRSSENILREIKECVQTHEIKNFFFKSDTFTMDKEWVKELCTGILREGLEKEISWAANSRTKPIDKATLELMKKAGCWMIALGIESGSSETLDKIKKHTTPEDNRHAVSLAKEAGLKTFGFYMIGFPWEHSKHLTDTRKHMFELNTDFVELHMAIPYHGTELSEIARAKNLLSGSLFGKDYFKTPSVATKYLSEDYIERFRKKTLKRYHLRFDYMQKRFFEILAEPKKLAGYARYGIRLLKNNMR